MGKPGIIAFPVILALGAMTGYLTYTSFTEATPDPGIIESATWKELTPSSGNETAGGGGGKKIDESKFSKVVTIKIFEGSSVQGNPDYDPDSASASSDALVTWINEDTTLHTATSGSGTDDAESGTLFSSGFLNPGGKFSIPAADIGKGEHKYYCQAHPYMTSTITIE
jgi:plastocyanin